MGRLSLDIGNSFRTMTGRTATSVFSIALLAGLSILGNCGKATAGYLPTDLPRTGDSLFASEKDASEPAVYEEYSSSASSVPQLSDNPFPGSDQPGGPLAGRNLITMCFGILAGRGNSFGGGVTGSSNQNSGSGPPLVCLIPVLAPSPQVDWDLVNDPHDGVSRSMASRLFRPPRLS